MLVRLLIGAAEQGAGGIAVVIAGDCVAAVRKRAILYTALLTSTRASAGLSAGPEEGSTKTNASWHD